MNRNTSDTNDNKKIKVGILGGTFDPIHNGHLMIAKEAMKEYKLSKILLIPTGLSYMKKDVTDSNLRYEMVKLAASELNDFEACDVEIQREGNTYTCDTIAYFRERYPAYDLYFIIGTDSLFSLEKWKNVEYILSNCTILCATRPGDSNELSLKSAEKSKADELMYKFNAQIQFIHCNPMDISSTEIRAYRQNHPNDNLSNLELPQSVAEFILLHDLYNDKIDEIHQLLKEDLKPKRLKHTFGVVDTAIALAKKWGCDVEKARLAALLHDCAKYLDVESKLALCAKYGVSVSNIELANPELIHAKAGALLAYEKYNISDRDILSAIYYHTTGKPAMSLLEQIIFVSDYIEPGRTHSDKLPLYRMMVMEDLNLVTAKILKDTVKYLKKQADKNVTIDPMTQETYDFYRKFLNEKE